MAQDIIPITDDISYLPASTAPLSCDVVFIKSSGCTWIFDVGACPDAACAINGISGKKNIVISHFHQDHTGNLPLVSYDNLFVSGYTEKHVHAGTVISDQAFFDDVKVFPMPSSHAKGCLALVHGDYAFLGDGAFCKYKGNSRLYNVQILNDMISFMENLPCKYFALDHEKKFIQQKEMMIAIYKKIYSNRKQGEPYINVNGFFSDRDFL